MDLIEVLDVESQVWGKPQPARAADERNAIPRPRIRPCSVIVRAKDRSSYNIYMFGGTSPDFTITYGDVWVLSIPSFRWFLVNTGLSTMPGTPPNYEAMTCYIVGGGSKMLVYGGRARPDMFQVQCDRTGIHVFDMTKLMWEEFYDPNGGEYEVPKQIYDVIGGGPNGGATLLPEKGMSNSVMEATFKDIIAKTTPTNSTNSTSRAPDSILDTTVEESSKSGVSGGTIAGTVVGAFVGISLIILGTRWLRKRSIAGREVTATQEVDSAPLTEMPTKLVPQELHTYGSAHYAHELHGYLPSEMATAPDERYNEAPHSEPARPSLRSRDRTTVVGQRESLQSHTLSGYGEEGVQRQSDSAGSEGIVV